MHFDINDKYTPREAATIAGVTVQALQNLITAHAFGRQYRKKGRRKVDLAVLLTVAAMKRLGNIRVPAKMLYSAIKKGGLPRGPLRITDTVTIDAPLLLRDVIEKLEAYESARERIVCDPEIMGGLPVIKGTQIPARTLHARVAEGESIENILEDYACLDRGAVEAAMLYMQANPRRGRPNEGRPAAG
jgi:uncharacterized protein (DUF433 family)